MPTLTSRLSGGVKHFKNSMTKFEDMQRPQQQSQGMERVSIVMYTCHNRRCTAELAARSSQVGKSLKCPHCYRETKVPNYDSVMVNVQCRS